MVYNVHSENLAKVGSAPFLFFSQLSYYYYFHIRAAFQEVNIPLFLCMVTRAICELCERKNGLF